MKKSITSIFASGVFLVLLIYGCQIDPIKNQSIGLRKITKDGVNHYTIEIRDTSKFYEIGVGGTLDEWNSAEYVETYGGNYYREPIFQPNEYLILENTGTTDIINPKIVVNDRRNYYAAKNILSQIVSPKMTDEEKAMAIYAFWADYETQGHNNNLKPGPPYPETVAPASASTFSERADPVKALNSYYAGGCSLISANFVILCRTAGIPARAVWMCAPENPNPILMYGETTYRTYATHCVAEAWYNNSWHLFDTDQRTFYRGADNQNIASYSDLHLNPYLVSRTISQGFVSYRKDAYSSYYEKYFPPKEMPVEQWLSKMNMTLRAGEKFIWKWDNVGKFRLGRNYRPGKGIPMNLANGEMIYKPQLKLLKKNNDIKGYYIDVVGENENEARLQPTVKGSKAEAIFTMKMPYPLVGASISADIFESTHLDKVRIFYSILNQDWKEVLFKSVQGENKLSCSLDSLIDPKMKPAIYSLSVKFELIAEKELNDVWISDVCMETDLHMNKNALPSLSLGQNRIHYSSETLGNARITHAWEESSETMPPLAPQGAVFPKDNQRVRLGNLDTLKWIDSVDPDQNGIAGYHIQISYREDMLLPVSTNLDQFTNQSVPTWAIPQGWLLNGETYYWRVRAKDKWGAWSQWSNVWQFKID